MKMMYGLLLGIAIFLVGCQNSPEQVVLEAPKAETPKVAVAKDTLPFIKENYEWEDGYIKVDWKFLSRVIYKEGYIDKIAKQPVYLEDIENNIAVLQSYEQDTSILLPIFHDDIKVLEGKPVQIGGYLIPFNDESGGKMHFLSAYPMSQCFFCGGAGPETLMDVLTKKSNHKFKMDDKVTFRGTLHLNDTDLDYMNYMLLDAEVVK